MEFIRRNIFYVGLLLIVGLLVGVMLAMKSSADGAAEKAYAEKQAVGAELTNLDRQKINPRKVEAQKQRNEQIIETARAVGEELVGRNRQNYEVIQLKAGNEPVPAFPVNEELYRLHRLKFEFPGKYHEKMNALIDSLKPAKLWTEAEEQEAIKRRETVLRAIEAAKAAEAAEAAEKGAAAEPGMPLGPMGPEMEVPNEWMRRQPIRRSDGQAVDLTAKARAEALAQLKQRSIRTGLMYVSPSVLARPIFTEPLISAPAISQLWEAQLRYWIVSDIVAAINQTNEQVIKAGNRGQTVADSAIKHLLQIDVEGYYFGTPAGSAEQVATLTGHVCNTLYDVKHYQFTVLMPTRYLPLLEEKLMERNLHTILDVQVSPPSATVAGAAEMRREDSSRTQDRYYYGTEPVSQVTVKGELLLLTEWERGKWDEKTQSWSRDYPPLIPAEVLANIQANSAQALRPEDSRRTSQLQKPVGFTR